MLSFKYSQESFQQWIKKMSKDLGTEPVNGFIQLPPSLGKGFLFGADYGKILSVSIQHFNFSRDFIIERPAIKNQGVFIYFNDIKVSTFFSVSTGKDISTSPKGERKNIYFSSGKETVIVESGKNNTLKRVGLFIPYTTIQMFFDEKQVQRIIQIIENTETQLNRIAITPRFQHLLDEIYLLKHSDELYKLKAFHKCAMLMNYFFQSLYDESLIDIRWTHFSKTDAANLETIEEILNDPETVDFPGIDLLAKKAFMSPTKLKKLFKKLHNTTIYSYYNSMRLKKARLLLESGNYSVKNAAEEIGFKSIGHFAAAYKKEFGKLPND